MASERSSSKGQAWFCTTGLPSDIVVEVDEMTFHLHKFPLMSKSRKLHQLITEQEQNPQGSIDARDRQEIEEDDDNEIEEVHFHIALPDFPGGSEIFEMAAKFCYGVKVDLSSANVAPIRCAGEVLEMTEEYCEDNLISKTESFLSQFVLKSLKESVRALKSCERVMPMAEELEIPQRCIDAVVSRASSADQSLFGWPVNEKTSKGRQSANQLLWNGIDAGNRQKGGGRSNNAETWLEDLSLLTLNFFKRLISAMREGDLNSEIIESCLMHYAKKYIPGVSRSSRNPSTSSATVPSEMEQRELLETIISNLPPGRSSRSSTGARFLFGLLRTANILNASEDCRSALERKVGSHLEQATLDDLLIPSYSYLNETLYDVDCVERILGYFLESLGERGASGDGSERSRTLMLVGKLIDGYLSEIASDANLKVDRFYNFAISLPEQARLYDDGLYRAIDVYLKAHPRMTEADREKICGVMDCQKLTLEACTHAAQNERLPLRAVVQVLFFEQLQLRHAIAGTLMAAEVEAPEVVKLSVSKTEEEEENDEEEYQPARSALVPSAAVPGRSTATWRATVRENQVLQLDMDSMRMRVHQLERECSTIKKVISKIDNDAGGSVDGGWRGSLNRKFGCKFKTQVCDSHAPANIVETRKGKRHGPSRT